MLNSRSGLPATSEQLTLTTASGWGHNDRNFAAVWLAASCWLRLAIFSTFGNRDLASILLAASLREFQLYLLKLKERLREHSEKIKVLIHYILMTRMA